jgi:hypothetical protein
MPLTREQTSYISINNTVFLPTVAIDNNLGVRGSSVFDGTARFNSGLTTTALTANGNSVVNGTFTIAYPGGTVPTFNITGNGEQTFRLYNTATSGSTRASWKIANRLNPDWSWIWYTDLAGNGTNDLVLANLILNPVFYISETGNIGYGTSSPNIRQSPSGRYVTFTGGGAAGGVFELVNTNTEGAGNYATIVFAADANTTLPAVNKSIAQLEAYTSGTTATNRGGTIIMSTKVDGGSMATRFSIDHLGTATFSSNLIQNINTTAKTAAYTLVLTDANTLIQMNGAFAFTVPLNATVPYPIGTTINLIALTAGVTVAFTGGITSYATPGLKLRAAGSMATLIKLNTDTWALSGDLTA